MSLGSDLKLLYHLFLSPIRGRTHAERLNSFYGPQADAYDESRARFLCGRRELYKALPAPDGGVWIEMGGGTGANLEHLGDRIRNLGAILYCRSLFGLAPNRPLAHRVPRLDQRRDRGSRRHDL